MKKLRPGFARIQFFSVQPEVNELLEKGHTLRSAYEVLFSKNKITMTYDTFRRNVRKFIYGLDDSKNKKQKHNICKRKNEDAVKLQKNDQQELQVLKKPFGKDKIEPKDIF